jgi:hypothetical protein
MNILICGKHKKRKRRHVMGHMKKGINEIQHAFKEAAEDVKI